MLKYSLLIMFVIVNLVLFGYVFAQDDSKYSAEFQDFVKDTQDVRGVMKEIPDSTVDLDNTATISGILDQSSTSQNSSSSGPNPMKIASRILTSGSIFFYLWKKYRKG